MRNFIRFFQVSISLLVLSGGTAYSRDVQIQEYIKGFQIPSREMSPVENERLDTEALKRVTQSAEDLCGTQVMLLSMKQIHIRIYVSHGSSRGGVSYAADANYEGTLSCVVPPSGEIVRK